MYTTSRVISHDCTLSSSTHLALIFTKSDDTGPHPVQVWLDGRLADLYDTTPEPADRVKIQLSYTSKLETVCIIRPVLPHPSSPIRPISHLCPQPHDELDSLSVTHQIRNYLQHSGDKLLHQAIVHYVSPLNNLPQSCRRQTQWRNKKAQRRQWKRSIYRNTNSDS